MFPASDTDKLLYHIIPTVGHSENKVFKKLIEYGESYTYDRGI